MAVGEISGNAANYIGLEEDTKPSGAPEGSTFLEVDTGQKWVCHEYVWYQDLTLLNALTQAGITE
jgi:hypothetical protein